MSANSLGTLVPIECVLSANSLEDAFPSLFPGIPGGQLRQPGPWCSSHWASKTSIWSYSEALLRRLL